MCPLPCDQLDMHEGQRHGLVSVVAETKCRAAHLNPGGCVGARFLRMSEAVECAELMLYGVSEKYKER